MNICVLGDTGLLGQVFCATAGGSDHILGISRASAALNIHWKATPKNFKHLSVDISDGDFSFLDEFEPDMVVNCSGLIDISACEADEALAIKLNSGIVAHAARAAADRGAKFVQISTDQVFDGAKGAPYTEEDMARPVHVYGRSKMMGEHSAVQNHPEALIVRTNVVGFRLTHGQTFAEWLHGSLKSGVAIALADDFVTSSIHAGLLAEIVLKLAAREARGIYHAASTNAMSKYEFGKAFALSSGVGFSHVKKVKLAELALKPARPAYSALDTSKCAKFLGQTLPHISDTISRLAHDANKFAPKTEFVQ